MNKFARMLMMDSRQGVKGTGRYGIGGRDYNEDMVRGRDGADYGTGFADGYDRAQEDMARGRRDRGEDYARGRNRGEDFARGGRDYASGFQDGYDRAMRVGDRNNGMGWGDMASFNDYGSKPKLFSRKDIETWKSMMKNEDGTRGAHFRPEQVKHACQQAGIDCEEFGEDVFSLAMNMKYSDTCKVAKKYGVDTPEYYADLAKAFLRDKDFDGEPEEKLYIYYKGIVEKDD